MNSHGNLRSFQVPLGIHVLSGLVDRFVSWWIALGKLETVSLGDRLRQIPIDRPVYISGLARSGTTILLELLSRHPDVATHKYRDFPGLFVPTWWNRGQKQGEAEPQERAHGDRLEVTQDSPEAMEESLWMAFFPNAHRTSTSNILDEHTKHESFEQFYRDHIRKLLLVRNRTRYVGKANYHFTRLAYLQKLFPAARFVAVIRHPRNHVASLIKQHRLFCAGETRYPRALAYMQRVGHFEFGLDRRPISVGDGVAEEVIELWQCGEEVRGTARYWASLYGWLSDYLVARERLNKAVMIVRYEDFCAQPQRVADRLLDHCGLEFAAPVQEFTSQIAAPRYYTPEFTSQEEAILVEETESVAQRFGYSNSLEFPP
ncbi:MAG: sulfotransferase [Pirellulales bacterium]|nr:sulfotransferase [Pirellulales bacterium]